MKGALFSAPFVFGEMCIIHALITFGGQNKKTTHFMKQIFCRILLPCLLPLAIFAQNTAPVILNLTASVNWSANTLNLQFDLLDQENDPLEVSVGFSNDGGKTYSLTSQVPVSGDVGFPVMPGIGQTISCDLSNISSVGSGCGFGSAAF